MADNFAVAVRLLSGQSITLQASAQDSLLSLQQRLEALTKDRDRYITTEVGQHQMWAAQ